MHQPKQWEEYISLVEFAYNNGYQESLNISPFEVLYGRKCRVPISRDNPVDKITLGPELLKDMEHEVIRINKNMKKDLFLLYNSLDLTKLSLFIIIIFFESAVKCITLC